MYDTGSIQSITPFECYEMREKRIKEEMYKSQTRMFITPVPIVMLISFLDQYLSFSIKSNGLFQILELFAYHFN